MRVCSVGVLKRFDTVYKNNVEVSKEDASGML